MDRDEIPGPFFFLLFMISDVGCARLSSVGLFFVKIGCNSYWSEQ
ncbi:hypothetical protein GGR96_003935 [Thalassospira tepidiphila]|uniref:Uncharacterized protein n=1 Tax=Thalassospira tepidiphila TaxID=393657 RepID=A0ABX0X5M8_9PROT|nr:hypothetical protein [Thalassospira tepidiphila]